LLKKEQEAKTAAADRAQKEKLERLAQFEKIKNLENEVIDLRLRFQKIEEDDTEAFDLVDGARREATIAYSVLRPPNNGSLK